MNQKTIQELEALAKNKATSRVVAKRCRIVLMAAEGISNLAISRTLKLSRPTVIQWRQRFEVFGKEVLINQNYSKAGRPRQHSENELEQLRIEATKLLKTTGLRKAAAKLGVSKSSLQRILSS